MTTKAPTTEERRAAVLDAMEKTNKIYGPGGALELAGATTTDHENWIKRNSDYAEAVEVAKIGQATRRQIAKRQKTGRAERLRSRAPSTTTRQSSSTPSKRSRRYRRRVT